MTIDLHVHSSASDGTQPPAEVVAAAQQAGLRTIALTDHDSTAGWDEAFRSAREHGVGLVGGIELSCAVGGIGVHMLAYLPNPADPSLRAIMDGVRTDRVDRLHRMVGMIAEDHDVTWDDVLVAAGATAASSGDAASTVTLGRPHLADALVARGIVADRDEAFATYLHRGSRYYLHHAAPQAEELLGVIAGAGGVAVIAHPRAGRRGSTLSDAQLARLVDAGMAGLEVDHRDHTPSEREQLRALATRLGVFVTGASDYHGAGKENRLGENSTAVGVLERILELGTGSRAYLP